MKARHLWGPGLLLLLATAPAAAIENRLGVGIHVWRTAAEVRKGPLHGNEHELTGILSYQLVLFRPLKVQLEAEYFPNGFGGTDDEAYYPRGLIAVGDRLYVAVGAGWIYSKNLEGHLSDIIYGARLGVDVPLASRFRLDLYAEQQSPDVSGLTEIYEETVTFAAVLRVRL
jgi:hypothetical protein